MGFNDYCPLCFSEAMVLFHEVRDRAMNRDFMRCTSCDLVSVPRRFHVGPKAEKKRYLEHNNDPDSEDYRAFLNRLWGRFRPYLPAGSKGLDYGAGPGPALAAMMEDDGFEVFVYDKYFSPDMAVLDDSYDFIVCTETVEHFENPALDFTVFERILKPSGWVGIMTAMIEDWSKFPGWYYHRDPTHIAFYSVDTMNWIAEKHGWQSVLIQGNIALFQG